MYVWFDALVNYISTLGWPEDLANFQQFWPAVQVAGKDNLRQQAAMWQAMLMSAGLPNSQQILINGFIGVDGQKMSKSLGNVIKPKEMVERLWH
jgi:methionyl-tRNA synthetase